MLMDIGTEEIGHVEMLATMIARLLETSPVEQQEDMAKNSVVGAVMGGARVEDAIVAGMNPQHMIVSRSEEHTSELQSRQYLVCRLLLEKKKPYTLRYPVPANLNV